MASDQMWSCFVLVIMIGTIFEYTDTGANNRCDDYNTYKDAMDGTGNENVMKNCTAPYNVTCGMEKYQTMDGSTAAHIRDCSDGKTFAFMAFNLYQNGAYTRLEALDHNNETTCVWDGNYLVCLTQCEGNFCNGPQLSEVNNGSHFLVPSLFLSFLLFLLSIKMSM